MSFFVSLFAVIAIVVASMGVTAFLLSRRNVTDVSLSLKVIAVMLQEEF